MFNFLKRKKKPEDKFVNVPGEQMIDIYYNLRYYQDNNSTNIAVIKNRKKFNWQLRVWKDKLNLKRGDRMIKLNDNRYIFIIDEIEMNLVHIASIEDLNENQIKYRKYM